MKTATKKTERLLQMALSSKPCRCIVDENGKVVVSCGREGHK
jgi:hypothetical protein